MNLRDAIIRGIRSSVAMALIAMLLQYGATWSLARNSPESLGAFSLTILVASFVSTFLVFGGNVFAPFFAELEEDRSRMRIASGYLAAVLAVGAVGLVLLGTTDLVSRVEALRLLDADVLSLAILLAGVMATTFVTNVENSLMNIGRSAVIQRLPILLFGPVLIVGFFAGFSWTPRTTLIAVVAGYGIAALFVLPRVFGYIRRSRGAEPLPRSFLVGFLRYVGMVQLSTITVFLYDNIERGLILTRVPGEALANLGIYHSAQMVNTLVLGIGRQLSFAIFPAFSHARRSPEDIRTLYRQATRYSLLAMGSLTILLAGGARILMGFFGSEFAEYTGVLLLLLTTTGVMAVGSVTASAFLALKRETEFTATNVAMITLYGALGFVLAPRLSLVGIAAAQLAAQCVLQGWMLLRLKTAEGLPLPRELLVLVPLLAGVVALVSRIQDPFFPVVVGVVAWALFLVASGVTPDEIKRRVGQMAGRS